MNSDMKRIERTPDQQEMANKIFDSQRDELLKRELSNTENYDKAILTLSAAALGISLTAITAVIPLETAQNLWLIKSGWVLLILSIITSLIAFILSNKAIVIQLKNAEDYYTRGIADAFNRQNIFAKINSGLNKVTGMLFSIAVISIVAFVINNIDLEVNRMAKEIKKTGTVIGESANIPTMQKVQSGEGIVNNSATVPTMQLAPGKVTVSTVSTTPSTSQGGSGGSSGSSGESKK